MNYIDDSWIAVSDNVDYKTRKIGERDNHPIVIVDNVLNNPSKFVEHIIKKVPLGVIEHETVVAPGHQGAVPVILKEIDTMIAWFINNFSDFKGAIQKPQDLEINNQVNVFRGGEKCKRSSINPHVDDAMFAYVLYLNNEEDCAGGTSFFSHRDTGETNMEYVDPAYKRTEQYWNYKEWKYVFDKTRKNEEVTMDNRHIEDVYEEYHHVPMKYNRMVIYPAYLWHQPAVKDHMFNEPNEPRYCLAGFVDHSIFTNPDGLNRVTHL
tara:strand:+ start:1153 stop:1947 length:795 start_codon:yes stop_codon:yes gene_type:complete